jgi:murein DD-endopeptidase MepM/ murein hydrolase activator NlpD
MGAAARPESRSPRRRRLALAAVTAGFVVPAVLGPAPAVAGPRERKTEVDAAAQAARADLEQSERAARQAAARLRGVEADLATARAEVAAAEQALAESRERDAAAAQELAEAEAALETALREEAEAAARVAEQEELVGDRASAAYRSGGQVSEWQVVLDSDDADELMSRIDYLSAVVGADGRLLDDLTAAKIELAELAAQRARAWEHLAALRERARQALAQDRRTAAAKRDAESRVDRLVAGQREAVAAAERQRAEDEALAARLEEESRRLEAELAEFARLARERAAQQAAQAAGRAAERAAAERAAAQRAGASASRSRSAPRASGGGDAVSVSSAPAGGGMVRPSSGRLSSGFGTRVHPIYRTERMHNGLDFAAPTGAPVVSALAGRVVLAGPAGAAGNRVVVDHGIVGGAHLTTVYMHLSRIDVGVGEQVGRGEQVGAVGSTGASTGPHLHFEVRRDGRAVDPLPHL